MTKQRKNWTLLGLIFLGAFLIRATFFIAFLIKNPCMLQFDSAHYHNIAVNIVHGLGFTGPDGAPYFYRLPGYPIFLAACYKLCNMSVIKTLWIQLFLGSLIPIFIYFFSLILFPTRRSAAFFAAILACIHVGFTIFSGLVMSDLLFLFFGLIFLILFVYVLKNKTPGWVFLCAGALVGVVSLIRPMGIFLILLVIFITLFSQDSLAGKSKRALFLFMGWLSIAGLWLARNFLLTGYLFFHTLSGPHFLNHMAANLVMVKNSISYEQASKIVHKEFDLLIAQKELIKKSSLLEIERVYLAEKITLDCIISNPILALKFALSNMLKTCFALYSSELLFIDSGGQLPPYSKDRSLRDMLMRFLNPHVNNPLIRYIIWAEILLFLLTLIGFFGFIFRALLLRQNLLLVLSLLFLCAFFVGITLACGYARFRLPIEPFLIILACVFWTDFFKRGICSENSK